MYEKLLFIILILKKHACKDCRMKIIIADQRSKIRSALRLLLEQGPNQRVVGEVDSLESLTSMVMLNRPDLVLLDWEMARRQFAEILSTLNQLIPGIKIIALSGNPEVSSLALEAGADAFVCKCDSPDRLLAAVAASV
jgi:DNA-binding NarL/FixJ family response regulator